MPKRTLIRSISLLEQKALAEYIKENLEKGYIRLLQLLVEVEVLFVLKKEEELRLYIDYRGLNEVIIKDVYLLLLIEELTN